jgi:DNA-binding NtrC family response regulator
MKVLVVDDNAGLRRSLTMILQHAGYDVTTADDGEDGLRRAAMETPDMILTDVRMPVMDGLTFLDRYRGNGGTAPVIVMTAYGGIDLAVQAVQRGAADYIAKPFGAEEVHLVLRKVEEREALRREVGRLRSEVSAARAVGGIVAESPGMARVVEMARKVARHPSSVLIQGATGTGKELMARMIHEESDRLDAPFVAVNCGAVPANLLESEFFGHIRGAFTGADRDREGLFEAAHLGTLFLDEVGEVPDSLQASLLRVLQEGEIRRVGESKTRPVDVRILAATNRDLREEVEAGRFREDLFYRLAVVTLEVPSLRDRPEDIPRLVTELLQRHASRIRVPVPQVTSRAMRWIQGQPWPGNVRELENALERALVMAEEGMLDVEDLTGDDPGGEVLSGPGALRGPGLAVDRWGAALEEAPGAGPDPVILGDPGDLSVKRWGAALERELIRIALDRTDGHRGQAADILELSPRALRYKIRDYGLEGEPGSHG